MKNMEQTFNSTNLILIILTLSFTLLVGITVIAAKKTLKQKRNLKSSSPIVCIKKFGMVQEAEIAKNLLIANQIKADIFYDNLGGYMGRSSSGSVELKIKEEDKEVSLKLLKELEKID